MNKFAPFALLATVATIAVVPAAVFAAETNQQVRDANSAPATGGISVSAGKMLYAADGKRIASVYRVTAAGWIKKAGTEMAVCQRHGDGASQHRHNSDQQVGGDKPGPAKHRHLH